MECRGSLNIRKICVWNRNYTVAIGSLCKQKVFTSTVNSLLMPEACTKQFVYLLSCLCIIVYMSTCLRLCAVCVFVYMLSVSLWCLCICVYTSTCCLCPCGICGCKLVLGAARGKRNQSGAGCTAQPQQPTPSMTCFDFIQHCHSPATLEDWSSGRIVCFLSGYDGASHHQPGKTEADLHPCRQLGGTDRGVRTAVRTTDEVQ